MPIQLDQVAIHHDNAHQPALANISTTINDSCVTLCIGKTGSGKSTMLDAIAGLLPLTSGTIMVDQTPLWQGKKITPELRARMGSVFQYPEHQLFARTVQDEFNYSLRPLHLDKAELERRVSDSLQQLGLATTLLASSPLTLSGGQKRRVALATTLATRPDWLLLDEPTAGLDPDSVTNLTTFLHAWRQLHHSGGVVIATHDLDVFLPIADYVLLMQDGQLVRYAATRELFAHPEWLTEIGIALPSLLETRIVLEAVGMRLTADQISPADVAEIIQQQIAHPPARRENLPQDVGTLIEATKPLPQAQNSSKAETGPGLATKRRFKAIDPRMKWFMSVVLSASILTESTWLGTSIAILVTTVFIALSGVSFHSVRQITKSFAWLMLVSVILSGLQFGHHQHLGPLQGVGLSIHSALATLQGLLRVLCVMEIGLLLPATTSQMEMKQALNQLLEPLRFIRFPVDAFALAASLMLRFIPVILQQLQRFSKIARARGKRNTAIGRIGVRDVPAIVIPLLLSVLELGEQLSLAMEVRGYHRTTQKRTTAIQLRFGKPDVWALCGTCIALMLLVLIR